MQPIKISQVFYYLSKYIYIITPRLFAKPSVLQWSLKNHLRKVFWFLAIMAQVYRYKRNHLSTRQRLLKKSNELLEASFAKMSSLQVFMAKSKLTEALRTGGNHHRYKIRPCMETNTTYMNGSKYVFKNRFCQVYT